MLPEGSKWGAGGFGLRIAAGLAACLWAAGGFHPAAALAEVVFLQDGRTIQADKVEVLGDRVRIERPTGVIELPLHEVMTIHPTAPPRGLPGTPPPADVYRELPQQLNDKVRREIETK
jgi:hypothetical protein